jgi:hypothetical protein
MSIDDNAAAGEAAKSDTNPITEANAETAVALTLLDLLPRGIQ